MANEKRLIDANALLAELDKFANPMPNESGYEFLRGIATAITEIEDAPTVDAVEVVHARWSPIRNFGGGECYGYCTNCKTPVKADNATGLVINNRFCHWCGAKMDGGNEDGST